MFVGSVATVVSRRALKSGDLAAPVPKSSFAVSLAQALSRYNPVELPAVQIEAARAVKSIFSSTALPVMFIPDARGRGFEVPKLRLLTLRLRVICHFERCGRKTFMQLLASQVEHKNISLPLSHMLPQEVLFVMGLGKLSLAFLCQAPPCRGTCGDFGRGVSRRQLGPRRRVCPTAAEAFQSRPSGGVDDRPLFDWEASG